MEAMLVNGSETRPGESDARDLVRTELERSSLSQAQAAREAGVTPARLSQWLAGKYQGDNKAMDAEMRRWLRSRAERSVGASSLPKAPDWTPTATARRILASLSYAQMAADIALVYGGAGLGKTCTAQHYQRNNPNVWIATMSPSTSSVATCLERIGQAVGLRDGALGASRAEAAILGRILDTGGLLIVDEAQHLSKGALEAVRSLHDAGRIGLALLGNESVYAQLTGGSRQAHFAQLFSRIGRRLRLNAPQKEDVTAILDAWGVEESATRTLCQRIAHQPGALRGLTKALRLAAMMAAGEEAPAPSAEHVKAAWFDLGGDAV